MTLSRSHPRAKPRWMALVAVVVFGSLALATTVLAAPAFSFIQDDAGPNDEPGQKDLTADAAAFDATHFWTAWRWDDTSWSGTNTGDACSLLDTDSDGNVNYAVCVTVATKSATEQSTRVYSCTDTKPDRCTGSVLLGTEATTNWCSVSKVLPGQFDAADTQAQCDVTLALSSASISATFSLINTCSYPSQQPNSDPSDCVHQIANVNTTTSTQVKNTNGTLAVTDDTPVANDDSVAIGTGVYDTATLSGNTATAGGTVNYYVQKQMATDTTPNCTGGTQIGTAVTVTNGSVPPSATTILSATGTYEFWAVYSGSAGNVGSTSTCGSETVIVTPNANGIGTSQSFVPNDSATLTGLTSDAGGTITFKLFAPSNSTCSTGVGATAPVVDEQLTVTAGQATYTTSNSVAVTAQGTYRWLVVYSGDANNAGATSACGIETFVLDNDTAN